MKHAIKGALLSGLVFPGVGQLLLKRYLPGLAFVALACACLAVIVTAATRQAMATLSTLDPGTITDPNALANAAAEAANAAGGPLSGLVTLTLAICWIWSIVDAWLAGRALDDRTQAGDWDVKC